MRRIEHNNVVTLLADAGMVIINKKIKIDLTTEGGYRGYPVAILGVDDNEEDYSEVPKFNTEGGVNDDNLLQ